MEVMSINPTHRLVAPRLWAATTISILLVCLIIVAGVGGAFVFNVLVQGVSAGTYIESATTLLQPADYFVALAKAGIFGFTAAMVACHRGMTCAKGPVGVGLAVKQSVVLTFLLIFFINYLITALYFVLVPPEDLMTAAQPLDRLRRRGMTVAESFGEFGSFMVFSGRVVRYSITHVVLRLRFRKEVARQISDIVVGAGAFIFGGGMVFVIGAMSVEALIEEAPPFAELVVAVLDENAGALGCVVDVAGNVAFELSDPATLDLLDSAFERTPGLVPVVEAISEVEDDGRTYLRLTLFMENGADPIEIYPEPLKLPEPPTLGSCTPQTLSDYQSLGPSSVAAAPGPLDAPIGTTPPTTVPRSPEEVAIDPVSTDKVIEDQDLPIPPLLPIAAGAAILGLLAVIKPWRFIGAVAGDSDDDVDVDPTS